MSVEQTQSKGQIPSVGSGSLLDVLGIAYKLRECHESMVFLYGDRWPERASEIKTAIREIAAKEKKSEMAVAVQRAKACDDPRAAIQILAAAYELSSSNTEMTDGYRRPDTPTSPKSERR